MNARLTVYLRIVGLFAWVCVVMSCAHNLPFLQKENTTTFYDVASPRTEVCLKVRTAFGQGTAFVLRHDRRVLLVTAYHCVSDLLPGVRATVLGNGVTREVEFHRFHDMDLAFAQGDIPEEWQARALPVGQVVLGEAVDAWGYGKGNLEMRHGSVLKYVPLKDHPEAAYLILDCDVDGGMSGGPVVNARGEVVALVTNQYSERHLDLDLKTGLTRVWETNHLCALDLP